MRRERQSGAEVGVASFHRRRTALADGAVVIEAQVGFAAIVDAAAYSQAQQAIDQRAAGVQAGLTGVAIVAVVLIGMVHAQRATPFGGDFLGDDVHHTTHGIGAVQGRHRATDHFDALDGRHRRHEAGGGFVEAIGSDVACGVLPAAIDQDQCVLAGQAADADVQAAGLSGALTHIDAFDVFQCLRQVAVALLLQVLLADHADARRRFGDLLFETGGTDDRVVERDRFGLGVGRQAAADQGAGQGGTCEGDGHAGSLCAVSLGLA